MKDPKRLERFQRWRAVFDTPAGKSVLDDLRKMCGQDAPTATLGARDGMIDPYCTLLKEGRRTVFLDIESCLREPPELPEGEVDEGTY